MRLIDADSLKGTLANRLEKVTLVEKIIQLVSDGYRIEFEPSYNHEAIDIVVHKDDYHSRYSIDWVELDKFYDTENAIMVVLADRERRIREIKRSEEDGCDKQTESDRRNQRFPGSNHMQFFRGVVKRNE